MSKPKIIEDIETLQSNLNLVESATAGVNGLVVKTITGTLSASTTAGSNKTLLSYPSGFTKDNMIILACNLIATSGFAYNMNGDTQPYIVCYTDRIELSNTTPAFASASLRLLVARY